MVKTQQPNSHLKWCTFGSVYIGAFLIILMNESRGIFTLTLKLVQCLAMVRAKGSFESAFRKVEIATFATSAKAATNTYEEYYIILFLYVHLLSFRLSSNRCSSSSPIFTIQLTFTLELGM